MKKAKKKKQWQKSIQKTFSAVLGSSLTTIAGFLALCSMSLTLGKDIGLVMAKGVLFGIISVVTILPALLLEFDKLIEKTAHKEILPKFNHLRDFIIKHYKSNNINIYYSIASKQRIVTTVQKYIIN